MTDLANLPPKEDYCKQFGCLGCKTVREALIKHWKNSTVFINKIDEQFEINDPNEFLNVNEK